MLKMNSIYFLFLILLASTYFFNEVEGLRAEKIIGGSPVRPGSLKYVVALLRKLPGKRHTNPCVGSILGNMFIATVAHCFYKKSTGELKNGLFYIAANVHDLSQPAALRKNIRIDLVYINKDYDATEDFYSSKANLAIVQLQGGGLGLYPSHPSLTSLTVRQSEFKDLNRTFMISGYGFNEVDIEVGEINGKTVYIQTGKTDGHLRYAKATLINDVDCLNKITNVDSSNMCVKSRRSKPEQPVGICKGDSGAPLVYNNQLYGIAINGFILCDEEVMPGIYINAVLYYTFIRDVMNGKITSTMRILQQVVQQEPEQFMFKQIY